MTKELRKHIEEELMFLEGLAGLKPIDYGRGKVQKRKELLMTLLGIQEKDPVLAVKLKGLTKESRISDLPSSAKLTRFIHAYASDSSKGYWETRDMKFKEFEGISISHLMKLRNLGKHSIKEFIDILTFLGVSVET